MISVSDGEFFVKRYYNDPVRYCREVLLYEPDSWQIEDLEATVKCKRIAVASGHGIGKVLSNINKVYTPDGIKLWGDIQVGDLLYGSDGLPTNVTHKYPHQNWPFYKITFDDGSFVYAGLEHLWNVRGRQERRKGLNSYRTLSTEDILKIGVKRLNGVSKARQWEIPTQSPVQFNEGELSLHPYIMGIWIGDGTRNHPEYSKPYIEIKERIENFGYKVITHSNGTNRLLDVCNLFRGGVFECNSKDRYIPDDYKYNSIKNRKELLRGLLDTDGEVHKSGSIGYSSTSKKLIDDVIWLVRSLGGKAKLKDAIKEGWYPDSNGKRVPCNTCYRITINLDWNPFTLKHRKEKYKPSEHRYITRWIDSIVFDHYGDGHCVTVSANDSLYSVQDFILTHNTRLVASKIHWFMSTRPDPAVVVTANTATQLSTKTWRELKKLNETALNRSWYNITATTMSLIGAEETWFASAIPWTEHRSEAFAGTHEQHVLYLFDEASAIPNIIWEVSEGAMSTPGSRWCVYGNPTRNSGAFFECFNKMKHRWYTMRVDSRTAKMTDKELIKQWIEDYGEDSDFVRIRVKGEFPRSGDNQFIDLESINNCFSYKASGHELQALVMGVDVARYGDDQTVFCIRQGRKVHPLRKWRGIDTMQTASYIAEVYNELQLDRIFIDGGGVGGGVVDRVKQLIPPNKVQEILSQSSTRNKVVYFNKRAEMWGDMRDAIRAGMELPEDIDLKTDLSGVNYGFTATQQIQLEKKEDMKRRGMASPDSGDSLALTFAEQVIRIKPKPKTLVPSYYGDSGNSWMSM
jgi:hypothetical protein